MPINCAIEPPKTNPLATRIHPSPKKNVENPTKHESISLNIENLRYIRQLLSTYRRFDNGCQRKLIPNGMANHGINFEASDHVAPRRYSKTLGPTKKVDSVKIAAANIRGLERLLSGESMLFISLTLSRLDLASSEIRTEPIAPPTSVIGTVKTACVTPKIPE